MKRGKEKIGKETNKGGKEEWEDVDERDEEERDDKEQQEDER